MHGENSTDHFLLFPTHEEIGKLGKNWRWILAMGVTYVIIGLIAFGWPVNSTLGIEFALGVLFIVGGIIQGVHSIHLRHYAGTAWRVFQSAVALIAGLLMLRFPEAGMMGVTIALTFYFFTSAIAKWIVAFGMRQHPGWIWGFVSGVISFLLGAYIIATFPFSALWIPGIVFGVDFVITGSALIGFSLDLRRQQSKGKTTNEALPFKRTG